MLKPKILIVEDELIIAKDISNVLENEGYDTLIGISTVEEAIKTIESIEFVLVLIDVQLSNNSDGVLLGRYLLNKDRIPFVYITSYSDNTTLERIKDTRPYGIIIKPFKYVDITSTITIILNNFRHKNIDILRNERLTITDEVPFVLKDVIDHINTNIENKINIIELSEKTKWTQHHFIKTFTKYIKFTPYQYILKKKVDKAKVLISETNIPIATIAFDLGFNSYSSFCNVFKKETGQTPILYRKLKKVDKHLN